MYVTLPASELTGLIELIYNLPKQRYDDIMSTHDRKQAIPTEEIEVSFSRSSGPGGQNVNKINSKALVIWNVMKSDAFTQEQKYKIINTYHTEVLQVSNQETRSQAENRQRAIEHLNELVQWALKEEKTRISTKPTIVSQISRILKKRLHSKTKKLRKKPIDEEN